MRVLTPRTVACVIPQEFHGINTDVTVTESSTVRLRSRLSNPLFLYSSLKRFPVSMMDRYWSAVQVLKKSPEATVEHTALFGLRTKRTKTSVMLRIIPLADMTPPKHMAHIMSQMVSIMPRIPRVATSASISGCPVDKEVLPNTEVIKALNPLVKSRVSPCAICRRI